MIFSENRFPLFEIMLEAPTPTREEALCPDNAVCYGFC
jgi:hypothetical protein